MRKERNIITYIVLILLSAVCMLPFYWLVRSSLMELGQIFQMRPIIWIPNPVVWENYTKALTSVDFDVYFMNTVRIVVFAVMGTIITSSISAYSFARLNWKGRDIVFGVLMTSMMLPYAVTLIPTFLGWTFIGGVNTLWPLILPYWFGGGIFNIFLLRQFYRSIPKELDEAALIDGAGYFNIFLKIILPLTKPALIVVGLFSFMFHWNDFLGPLVYLNDEGKYTLAIGLQMFMGMYTSQWNLMMAAATVVILPVLIVFLIGQKYFIEGIALTGMKG